MGKFTKDKRVTRNLQYSNHVLLDSYSNAIGPDPLINFCKLTISSTSLMKRIGLWIFVEPLEAGAKFAGRSWVKRDSLIRKTS